LFGTLPVESSRNLVSSCAAQAWASRLVVNVADVRVPLMHTSARQPPLLCLNEAISDPLRFTPMAYIWPIGEKQGSAQEENIDYMLSDCFIVRSVKKRQKA
jgi:hypothetical protein